MNNYTPKSVQLVKREMAWTHLLKILDQYEQQVKNKKGRFNRLLNAQHIFFITELRKVLQSIEKQTETEIIEHLQEQGFSDRQIERLLNCNDNVSFIGGKNETTHNH